MDISAPGQKEIICTFGVISCTFIMLPLCMMKKMPHFLCLVKNDNVPYENAMSVCMRVCSLYVSEDVIALN